MASGARGSPAVMANTHGKPVASMLVTGLMANMTDGDSCPGAPTLTARRRSDTLDRSDVEVALALGVRLLLVTVFTPVNGKLINDRGAELSNGIMAICTTVTGAPTSGLALVSLYGHLEEGMKEPFTRTVLCRAFCRRPMALASQSNSSLTMHTKSSEIPLLSKS
jgi:hypothetical protein